MCGITGIVAFNEIGKKFIAKVPDSIASIKKRGPDNEGLFFHNNVGLGHVRLSIIDVSDAASQPFTDASGRYTIVYNGEIYNFKELKKSLTDKGITFRSQSDTEVILQLYITEGSSFLNKLNGFFAFAIYDKQVESLFIVRDRYGIKPLLIYQDEDKLIFSSEMKGLLAYGIEKTIDTTSLSQYLHLNYIPSPWSIFRGVTKQEPGTFRIIKHNKVVVERYYQILFEPQNYSGLSYEQACNKLSGLLDDAVQRRLIADVPLGAFLSGGIDSSVIVALASKYVKDLKTFSIGYKDEPLFDETKYAELVAKKYKTDHHVFLLSNNDLLENLFATLDYIDEPFADSSALAVNILSKQTKQSVTVALSGDGADELFAGYNKHAAEYKARHLGAAGKLINCGSPLWKVLPKSRNSSISNKIRQFDRFAKGIKMNTSNRYWRWCGFTDEDEVDSLLKYNYEEFQNRKIEILKKFTKKGDINEVLLSDVNLVLQSDMLTKVDMMSMAHSLEIRVPFLDYTVVDFAFSLKPDFKIDNHFRKKILRDSFANLLPTELLNRPKHGFEVPLQKWFRNELFSMIAEDLLSDKFVEEQNIFNPTAIKELKKQWLSNNPGESISRIWGLIVFQYWWKKIII